MPGSVFYNFFFWGEKLWLQGPSNGKLSFFMKMFFLGVRSRGGAVPTPTPGS